MKENKREYLQGDNQKLEDKDAELAIDIDQRDKRLDSFTDLIVEADLFEVNSTKYQRNDPTQRSLINKQDWKKTLQYEESQTSSWRKDCTEISKSLHIWKYDLVNNKS